MIQGKWTAPGTRPEDGLSVRRAVFGFGQDPLDGQSWNVTVYQDEVPAASGRLWWQGGVFRLGEVGVLPAYRGRKLGDLTLRLLLFKAQSHFAREIRLRCTPETAGFFSRLGFEPASPFPEEPLPDGLLEMAALGSEINLDSCASCRKTDCPRRQE